MKRVYTDERFPGIEVHNDGTARFRVVNNGQEEDSFTTFRGQAALSEPEAQRRAQAYFDRMAQGQMSDELLDRDDGGLRSAPARPMKKVQLPDEDDTEAFNNPPAPRGHIPQHATMTHDDVLDLYQRAKATADPAERERLMQQVKSMSQQLESCSEAEETVKRLLD